MALSSSIEWTESTWNPLTGCTKVSPGCANCYAERLALRLKAMGSPNYANGFGVTIHEEILELPRRYPRASAWHFINQASLDLNPGVPDTQHISISSLPLSPLSIQSIPVT
ncbi:MAG: DUF5131 family protein, partial [Chloroflexi bacterium]|nr:DUF5131 family protein [Chloroflexota bacterium]